MTVRCSRPSRNRNSGALAARSTAFSDMCTRFDRVWDSLNELDQEPMRTEEVRGELGHLETLMLAMAQDQMRV